MLARVDIRPRHRNAGRPAEKSAPGFVERYHRHSARTSNDGGKFAIGLELDAQLVGVAIVGRPVARLLQEGLEYPAELLRLCTSPAAPKGSGSKLYSRAKRIWQLMGGVHFKTYTLASESGATMRGAGVPIHEADIEPERWDRDRRPRAKKAIEELAKRRWGESLAQVPA